MTSRTLAFVDRYIIRHLAAYSGPISRLALFVVYFWFGALKVVGASPASPLVAALLARTMPFIAPDNFIILFGLFEVLIGILWLAPGAERAAILLLAVHLVTTVMPLVLLPHMVWTSFLIPTLEGQYIIKNIIIIALAVGFGARLKPITR